MKRQQNLRIPTSRAGAAALAKTPKDGGWRLSLVAAAWLGVALSVGATTNTWTGGGAGNDNWSTPANWDVGAPAEGADVRFLSTDGVPNSGTANNIVDTSRVLNSLWYQASNAWQVTQIPAGTSLSVTGALATYSLFAGYSGSGNSANNYSFAAVRGQGRLVVNNQSGLISVRVGIGTTGAARAAHLDLSNLDSFTADVGRILVGAEGNKAANNNRPGGVIYLAKTNVIRGYSIDPVILIGDGGGDQGGGTNSVVNLGDTNVFLFDSGITVGGRRNRGIMRFWSAASPVAYFRDLAGTGRQNIWAIGDNSTGADSTVSAGTNDFSGGTVDALVDSVIVGRGQTGSTGSANGSGTGTLILGAGRLDANTMGVGYQRPGGSAAIGTVQTSGGATATNLVVNGNVTLGNYDGLAAASATVGTVSVGSTVIIIGDIISGGSALNSVNLTNGHLVAGGIGNNSGANDVPLPTLNLESGVVTLDLGTSSNPTTPVCNVTNLYINTITLNVAGTGLSPGVIPLIKVYSGAPTGNGFAGITQGSLPLNPKVWGSFSNSTDTLYLVIDGVDVTKWKGSVNGDWDIATTTNWVASYSGTPLGYQEATIPGDAVRFDDTATGTTAVNLTTTLSPSVVTVDNSSKTYTFSGSGRLSGPGGLNKLGPGTLVLANSGVNDFAGDVTVTGGKVQLGTSANRLPTEATVSLTDAVGVSLDLNGFDQQLGGLSGGGMSGGNAALGTGTLTLSGDGNEFTGVISGGGKLVKTNTGTQVLSGANTYSGGTEVRQGTLIVANTSGSGIGSGNLLLEGGTLQIGNAGAAGSISQSVITNNGILAINRSDDLTFDKLITGSGNLVKMGTSNTVSISTANSHTGTNFINGGGLRISHPQALGASIALIRISTVKPAQLELLNNITVANPMEIVCKQAAGQDYLPAILNLSDTNTVSGLLSGIPGGTDYTFQSEGGKLVISGLFTNTTVSKTNRIRLRGSAYGEWQSPINDGASELSNAIQISKMGAGTWVLAAANAYTGATTVEEGTLVVNGAILNSAYVSMANSSGQPARLAGDGYIACPVTNGTYGVLSPGNSIGTLTISNRLVLQQYSSCEFEISASGYDQVRGLSSVTFGGTLNITVSGSLAGVEVFKLFDATTYSGGFDGVNLPGLPAPLGWDTTDLQTQGILRVTGGVSVAAGLVSGNMQLSGAGPANNGYRVLATTNVALPLDQWSEVGSGNFAGDGSYTFTDVNTSSYPRRFYRVVTP